MRSAIRIVADIWPSLVAAVLLIVGAFLSMGLLGLVVYHLASPALNLWFPPLDNWDQSSVWPVIIAMPIAWSPAFIVAGVINRQTKTHGWTRKTRIPLYLAIVWCAAIAVWSAILIANPALWR
jgi:hypothetical protein